MEFSLKKIERQKKRKFNQTPKINALNLKIKIMLQMKFSNLLLLFSAILIHFANFKI